MALPKKTLNPNAGIFGSELSGTVKAPIKAGSELAGTVKGKLKKAGSELAGTVK